jgi:hypothetical protein
MARGRGGSVLAAGALVGALALLAAGCGGSGKAASGTTTTTPAAAAGARTTAFQAFRQCLQQHGVTLPQSGGTARPRTPGVGGFRRNLTSTQQKAFTTCRSKLPSGGLGFRPGNGGRFRSPAFAKYTQCLRAHGVTFGKAAAASAFQKAQAACAKYRPTTPTTTSP